MGNVMKKKRCTKCEKLKAHSDFPVCKDSDCVSGSYVSGRCKACHSQKSLDYYHRKMKGTHFKKKMRDKQRAYREDPVFRKRASEKTKKKRLEEPGVRKREKKYYKENRERINKARRKRLKNIDVLAKKIVANEERRARLAGAKIPRGLPPLDKKVIQEMITMRLLKNKKAGYKKFCVDHIIPICRGGFQHQDNLRVITTNNNAGQGGKFDQLDSEWGKVPYCHYRRKYYTIQTRRTK
jgi:hypothetical protein